jgi:uncharacterized RDD family membrane protein YckC
MSTVQPPTALLAGIGSRVVQFVVDLVLVAVVSSVITLPFDIGESAFEATWGRDISVANPLDGIAGLLAGALVFVGAPALLKGQTIGMLLLRIRVIDENGRPAGAGPLVIRWLMLFVDFLPLGLLGLVGVIVMWSRPDQRRVGDILARTYVVRA